MHLQLARVLTVRLKGLGNNKTINVASFASEIHLRERGDDRWSELTTVTGLGQRNIIVRVEKHQRVTIVFALATPTEIVRVERTSMVQYNYLLVSKAAVFGVCGKIFIVIPIYNVVEIGIRGPASLEVEVVRPFERSHVTVLLLLSPDNLANVWISVFEFTSNSHTCVNVVGSDLGVSFGNQGVLEGTVWQFTSVIGIDGWCGRIDGSIGRSHGGGCRSHGGCCRIRDNDEFFAVVTVAWWEWQRTLGIEWVVVEFAARVVLPDITVNDDTSTMTGVSEDEFTVRDKDRSLPLGTSDQEDSVGVGKVPQDALGSIGAELEASVSIPIHHILDFVDINISRIDHVDDQGLVFETRIELDPIVVSQIAGLDVDDLHAVVIACRKFPTVHVAIGPSIRVQSSPVLGLDLKVVELLLVVTKVEIFILSDISKGTDLTRRLILSLVHNVTFTRTTELHESNILLHVEVSSYKDNITVVGNDSRSHSSFDEVAGSSWVDHKGAQGHDFSFDFGSSVSVEASSHQKTDRIIGPLPLAVVDLGVTRNGVVSNAVRCLAHFGTEVGFETGAFSSRSSSSSHRSRHGRWNRIDGCVSRIDRGRGRRADGGRCGGWTDVFRMIVVGKALHPSTGGGTAPSSAASVWVATTPTPTCETVRFSSVGEPLETLSRTGFALFFAPNTLAVTPLSVTVLVVPGTTAAFFCFWFTTSNHNHIESRVRERKHKKGSSKRIVSLSNNSPAAA